MLWCPSDFSRHFWHLCSCRSALRKIPACPSRFCYRLVMLAEYIQDIVMLGLSTRLYFAMLPTSSACFHSSLPSFVVNKALPSGDSFPSSLKQKFLKLSLPQESSQWMTVKMALQRYKFVVFLLSKIWSTSWDNPPSESWSSVVPFILTCVCAWASFACPEQPGNLEITSRTFAAVKGDTDAPGSVNTAQFPASPFTRSPLNTTLPLYFWNYFLQFGVLEMSQVHKSAKKKNLLSL